MKMSYHRITKGSYCCYAFPQPPMFHSVIDLPDELHIFFTYAPEYKGKHTDIEFLQVVNQTMEIPDDYIFIGTSVDTLNGWSYHTFYRVKQ